jgi:hypothetical protein
VKRTIYWAPDEGGAGAATADPTAEGAGASSDGNGQGDAEIAYLSQMSPEVREKLKERLTNYPKINDLAQAVVDQEDKLSRAVIVPNAENPDAEELKAFKKAMGLPEKAEEYEIKLEGIEGGEEVAGLLRKAAFNMGLTKTQAKKFGDVVLKLATAGKTKQAGDQKEAAESFEPQLLEKLGGDEEKKAEVLNLFKRFLIKRVADNEIVKALTDARLIHNPGFAMKMAEIERHFSDEPFVQGRPQGAGAAGTQQQGQFGGNYSPEFQQQFGGKS